MQTGVSPVLCVKESIVATLQLLRIVFPRFRAKERKKERKKVCHSGTFEFSLLILYIVTTRRILRLRLRCRLYYLTKFLTLHERTCAKVFESMKIFNR